MSGTITYEAATDAVALEWVRCNLCGADDSKFLYRKPDTRLWASTQVFDVVRCRRCGLGYVNPRPTADAIRVFYPPRFYEGRAVDAEYLRYEVQAAYLGPGGGRVLDVGCARGAFLEVLRGRGWDVEGVERFPVGNDGGVPIRHGELPALGLPGASFDAVTAWGVFEHLHDPMVYFAETARLLKPSGRFVCLVTNLRSFWSRFAYADDVPRHLYFFSARTLRRYATHVGLRVRRLDYTGSVLRPDTTDLFRVRLLRRLGFSWNAIYHSTARPAAVRLLERAARVAGVALFSGPLERWLCVTGVIVAVMEKPAR